MAATTAFSVWKAFCSKGFKCPYCNESLEIGEWFDDEYAGMFEVECPECHINFFLESHQETIVSGVYK